MMSIPDWFKEGGWGMWPTLVFGSSALIGAVWYARQKTPVAKATMLGMTMATLFSGLLGVTEGLITTFKAVSRMPPDQQSSIALLGASESLQNLVLALCFATMVTLVYVFGAHTGKKTEV